MIRNKLAARIFTKLAGAGFTMFVIYTFLLLQTGFDMYEFVEAISSKFIWMIVYLYGVFCSLLIDLLERKIPKINKVIKIFLYIAAGFSFFLFNGINVFTIIAGTIGALCSLIFYFGTYLTHRSKGTKYAFAIFVPVLFIILMNIDFTEKTQWNDVRDDSSYTATFEYFDGKHDIPINLESGQTITLSITFDNQNGGGYGYHVRNEKDQLIGLTEVNEGVTKFTASDTGVYRVVVKGDALRGTIKVKWKLDKTN